MLLFMNYRHIENSVKPCLGEIMMFVLVYQRTWIRGAVS
jgi:hypothetical protein